MPSASSSNSPSCTAVNAFVTRSPSRAGRRARRPSTPERAEHLAGVRTEARCARGRAPAWRRRRAGTAPAGAPRRSPDPRPSPGRGGHPCADRRRCRRRCTRSRRAHRCATQRFSISVASSVAVHAATMPLISSLRAARSASLAKRGSVDQIGLLHRLAQTREVRVGAGDDADVLAVAGRIVVERRGVGEAVAFPVAHDAEPVVAGERPLQDAQRRAVERGVDHHAAPASRVPRRTARRWPRARRRCR